MLGCGVGFRKILLPKTERNYSATKLADDSNSTLVRAARLEGVVCLMGRLATPSFLYQQQRQRQRRRWQRRWRRLRQRLRQQQRQPATTAAKTATDAADNSVEEAADQPVAGWERRVDSRWACASTALPPRSAGEPANRCWRRCDAHCQLSLLGGCKCYSCGCQRDRQNILKYF